MKIHNLKFNQFSQVALATLLIFLFAGCSGGGSSSTASTTEPKVIDKSLSLGSTEDPSGFTVVVGIPFAGSNMATPLYDDLFVNLTSAAQQNKLRVSRILLSVQNPGNPGNIFNATFQIDDAFKLGKPNNGKAIQFLSQLAEYNSKAQTPIEVYAYPDVEASSQWEFWNTPTSAPKVTSCSAASAPENNSDPSKQAMLKSICWASLVNQLIGGDKPIIAGVAYDSQSNYLPQFHGKDPVPFNATGWTYPQVHADTYNGVELKFGWITGKGIAASNPTTVDLNLVEVYDLNSNKNPAFDALTASKAGGIIVTEGSKCTGILCSYNYSNVYPDTVNGNTVYKQFFPGAQYAANFQSNTDNFAPALGANIYQCALSKGSPDYGCNGQYSSNVDVNATLDVQILQAMNYVWTATPNQLPTAPYYGAKNYLAGNVVYLFSTQYAGPVGSYYGKNKTTGLVTTSKSLCTDLENTSYQCSCIASKYTQFASCGDENSFGSWGNNLADFKNFVFGPSGFMSSQGGNNCPGNSCSPGLYMYDFIPSAWYK